MEKVDIVVSWVDGSDKNWLACKAEYDDGKNKNSGNCDARFRDFDLMRYFFRGIEKNMPWVNKIFFVTWGHVPSFLKTDHEKIRIINHKDYIPEKYLPTFNSNVIELNYHRIPELSENFILFNDDIFAVKPIGKEKFFSSNGLPRDMLEANSLINYDKNSYIWHMAFNDMGVINHYFTAGLNAYKHFRKWVNFRYPLDVNVKNLYKMSCRRMSGFLDFHFPVAYKKSSFEKIWNLEGDYLDSVCMNRFRSPLDLNQWLVRYWEFATGEFEPVDNTRFCKYYEFGEDDEPLKNMCKAIVDRERAVLVLNDTLPDDRNDRFDDYKLALKDAFEQILPDKCSFEI